MRSSGAVDPGTLVSGSRQDPVAFVAHVREHDPVAWIPGLDAWLVTRHEDVRALLADPRLTTDPRAYERYRSPSEPGATRWLTEMPFRSTPSDPPSPGRRLVSSALTPRAVERMERRLRRVVQRLAGPLQDRHGTVDLLREFTTPVSATALGVVLGVPPKGEDELRFRELAARATRAIRPILSDKQRARAERAGVEMAEYVLDLVGERRRAPGDDLISALLAAPGEREAADERTVVATVAALVSAGTGTTAVAGARALRTLLQHPDQLDLLRRDSSLLPNAVEELLRYDSGLVVMPRYVVRTLELRGRTFAPGQLVALALMAANRDPRVFPRPDDLDLLRDTRDSLSFGFGPHYCIGANLARIEVQCMIEAALEFLPPQARVLEGEIRWSSRGLMSQIKSLPVDLGRGPTPAPPERSLDRFTVR